MVVAAEGEVQVTEAVEKMEELAEEKVAKVEAMGEKVEEVEGRVLLLRPHILKVCVLV
jgi:methyl-accepting chemotaxis protein